MSAPENFIDSEADALSGGFSDEREPDFKSTLFVIFTVHIAVISFVTFFEGDKKQSPAPLEQITWMDADALMAAASAPLPEPEIAPEPVADTEPMVVPDSPSPPYPEPEPEPEPKAEPVITLKPKPEPEKPKDEPKPDKPKPPKPKPVTKPFVAERKLTPKPKPDPKPKQGSTKTKTKVKPETVDKKPALVASNNTATGKEGTAQTAGNSISGGKPGGISQSELSSYFRSVGEKFRAVWDEPVSVIRTGHNLVAYVRIRVKADGSVESATLNGSSGSREMDDSVRAAFPAFKSVPPPPAALLKSNGCMEETMEIKLGL